MKWVTNIFVTFTQAAQNKWVWLRVIGLVLIATGCFAFGAWAFSKTKVKIDETCEKDRGKLIQALIEIKSELQAGSQPISFTGSAASFMFASFDTLPQQKMQQRKINKVLSKIDSIILKYRLDSIKKTKTKIYANSNNLAEIFP